MHSKNEVELSFDARSVNEGFARMAVAAFITELNPTMDELSDVKTAVSEAGREAGGAARARGPRQQGERRHGARARLLGVGGRPHGRGGVGGGPPHISQSPRKRFDPKPLRRTSGPFSASAQGATRVHRLSVRRRSLSRSNGLPSERSPRADIKLQRRASVRHAEVAADGLI